jgi:hypothetical protein
VPNSRQITANAKPESQREPLFITSHLQEKCSVQVAVMHHFASFSKVQPIKRFMLVMEIHMLAKLEEGGFLFLVAKETLLMKIIKILQSDFAFVLNIIMFKNY